jgi:hypothetical protein
MRRTSSAPEREPGLRPRPPEIDFSKRTVLWFVRHNAALARAVTKEQGHRIMDRGDVIGYFHPNSEWNRTVEENFRYTLIHFERPPSVSAQA